MRSITLRKSAEKLVSKVSGYWDNAPDIRITEEVYTRLANDLARLENMDTYTLYQSCVSIIGKQQTKDEIYKICYFVKANKEAMKDNIIPMGLKSIPDGQHEMRITNALRTDSDFISLELLVTTGPCAMSKTRINGVSLTKAQMWLYHMGYSVTSDIFYPGSTAMSFIGCYAMFDYNSKRNRTSEQKLGPVEIVYNESIKQYNRSQIIKPRRGLSECPFGLTEKISVFQDYCWNWCLHGQCDCPASYHENNFVVGPCQVCKRIKTPIDPENPEECQQCHRKRLGITDFD